MNTALIISALIYSVTAVGSDAALSGGNMTLSYSLPTFNLAACDDLADPIDITLESSLSIPIGSDLHVWWAASSTSSCEDPDGQLLNLNLEANDDLVQGAAYTWSSLSVGAVFTKDGACGRAVSHTEHRLCFGVDTDGDGVINLIESIAGTGITDAADPKTNDIVELELTVGEAVMRMDLAELPAQMFFNRSHGGMNVVFRRPDGNIGWIDPQITAAE